MVYRVLFHTDLQEHVFVPFECLLTPERVPPAGLTALASMGIVAFALSQEQLLAGFHRSRQLPHQCRECGSHCHN